MERVAIPGHGVRGPGVGVPGEGRRVDDGEQLSVVAHAPLQCGEGEVRGTGPVHGRVENHQRQADLRAAFQNGDSTLQVGVVHDAAPVRFVG
jgi:hypothetical protein